MTVLISGVQDIPRYHFASVSNPQSTLTPLRPSAVHWRTASLASDPHRIGMSRLTASDAEESREVVHDPRKFSENVAKRIHYLSTPLKTGNKGVEAASNLINHSSSRHRAPWLFSHRSLLLLCSHIIRQFYRRSCTNLLKIVAITITITSHMQRDPTQSYLNPALQRCTVTGRIKKVQNLEASIPLDFAFLTQPTYRLSLPTMQPIEQGQNYPKIKAKAKK
jgi:hypothetical protein